MRNTWAVFDTYKAQFVSRNDTHRLQKCAIDVLFLHDFLLKFHALTSVFKIGQPTITK